MNIFSVRRSRLFRRPLQQQHSAYAARKHARRRLIFLNWPDPSSGFVVANQATGP
jgi:hypothetical protein